MPKIIKAFIVDDHPLILDGLTAYLRNSEGLEVVGTANNGEEALKKMQGAQVDILMTDIHMPKMDGIRLTEEVLKLNPKQKILILTMFGEVSYIKRLLHLGVQGYILKDIDKSDLLTAIKEVVKGKSYFSKEITEVMMNKLRGVAQKSANPVVELTEREKEILHLILKQKGNQEIADELYISPRTVEAHKRNLLSKTGSKNVAGLVIFAMENHVFPDFK